MVYIYIILIKDLSSLLVNCNYSYHIVIIGACNKVKITSIVLLLSLNAHDLPPQGVTCYISQNASKQPAENEPEIF